MAQVKSSVATVLLRVVARLIDQLSEFTTNSCYIALSRYDAPSEAHWSENNLAITVSTGGGSFDQGWIEGGGVETTKDDGTVAVTIWSNPYYDEMGVDAEFQTQSVVGVLNVMKDVIIALNQHVLLDASGDEILIEPIYPESRSEPQRPEQDKPGSVTIAFGYSFTWESA